MASDFCIFPSWCKNLVCAYNRLVRHVDSVWKLYVLNAVIYSSNTNWFDWPSVWGDRALETQIVTRSLKGFFFFLTRRCTRRSRNNRHNALIFTTPLFYILAPTYFYILLFYHLGHIRYIIHFYHILNHCTSCCSYYVFQSVLFYTRCCTVHINSLSVIYFRYTTYSIGISSYSGGS
jgi:hypothetical protein